MLFLVLSLAALAVIQTIIIFWLLRTMKKNINVQAQVTAELLEQSAEAFRENTRGVLQKLADEKYEHAKKMKTIQDLESSVEVLHAEIERLEEILRLEHDIKNA